MKKIVFLIGSISKSETFIEEQVLRIASQGFKVDLVVMHESALDEQGKNKYEQNGVQVNEIGIPRSYPRRLVSAMLVCFKLMLRRPKALLQALNLFRYRKHVFSLHMVFALEYFTERGGVEGDVLHAQFGPFGITGAFLVDANMFKGLFVTSFRGSDATSYPSGFLGRDVYKRLFMVGDRFFPVSQSISGVIERLGCDSKKIVVIPSGIDCSFFTPRSNTVPDGTLRMISAGRLVEKRDRCRH